MTPGPSLLNAGRIAEMVEGRLTGSPETIIRGGRADSRLCRADDLYVALPGERTDGSLYIVSAWERGASVALADRTKNLPRPPQGKSLIAVDNPLASLQELAGSRRGDFPELKIIGITGSNGKTTTKDILSSILSTWKGSRVLTTEGNFNSEIGLPLTLLGLRDGHEIAVLEMGMNRAGEMELLARIARPDICLITNIGTAHVGMLGSREAVAGEKRAIFTYSGRDSVALVGQDEPWGDFLLKDFPGTVRRFGSWGIGGWETPIDRGLDGWTLIRNGAEINFALAGRHNVFNAMAAVEAALVLGAPESVIAQGLEAVTPAFGRSEVLKGKVTVVRDCYNANPESLNAALEMFAGTKVSGRKILVLGEFRELGHETEDALRLAGSAAAAVKPEALFLFGETLEILESAALKAGYPGPIRRFSDIDELRSSIAAFLTPGDFVLIKGSRGSALERLDTIFMEVGSV